MTSLYKKKFLVLGSGLSGQSMIAWGYSEGATVYLMDEASEPRDLPYLLKTYPSLPYTVGNLDQERLEWADIIGISPGIPFHKIPARIRPKVVSDIELFAWSSLPYPIIAVTGSNGKTTTTTLIAHLLRQRYEHVVLAGNTPLSVLSRRLSKEDQDTQVCVLELSSFQLYWTRSLRCLRAGILNLSTDHLNWHQTDNHYYQSKLRLMHCCEHLVLNADDPLLSPYTTPVPCTYFGYGPSRHPLSISIQHEKNACYLCTGQRRMFPLNSNYTAHQISNIMASVALCQPFTLSDEEIDKALMTMPWPRHRLEQCAEYKHIRFYDDSKATNIGATIAALQALNSRVCIILGGQGKSQDFHSLMAHCHQYVAHACLIGEASDILATLLDQHHPHLPKVKVTSMLDAVNLAYQAALRFKAACVLLSPACASQDMFRDYAERGECFQEAVKTLLNRQTQTSQANEQ